MKARILILGILSLILVSLAPSVISAQGYTGTAAEYDSTKSEDNAGPGTCGDLEDNGEDDGADANDGDC
jgi:hypothetical protein